MMNEREAILILVNDGTVLAITWRKLLESQLG